MYSYRGWFETATSPRRRFARKDLPWGYPGDQVSRSRVNAFNYITMIIIKAYYCSHNIEVTTNNTVITLATAT